MTTTELLTQTYKVENLDSKIVIDEIPPSNPQLFEDIEDIEDDSEEETDEYDDDYNDRYDDDDYDDWSNDWGNEGCGEGFSCSECSNYGCNAHPCN